jgi:propanediol dehydratase small subunit
VSHAAAARSGGDGVPRPDGAGRELAVRTQTLRARAAVARRDGDLQLADSLERAAELGALPDHEVRALHELLRPGRATAGELAAVAARLESMGAVRNAALVLEAAGVYARRGQLRS